MGTEYKYKIKMPRKVESEFLDFRIYREMNIKVAKSNSWRILSHSSYTLLKWFLFQMKYRPSLINN